jgi:hypothetical protein
MGAIMLVAMLMAQVTLNSQQDRHKTKAFRTCGCERHVKIGPAIAVLKLRSISAAVLTTKVECLREATLQHETKITHKAP